jgi:hypothetical protein
MYKENINICEEEIRDAVNEYHASLKTGFYTFRPFTNDAVLYAGYLIDKLHDIIRTYRNVEDSYYIGAIVEDRNYLSIIDMGISYKEPPYINYTGRHKDLYRILFCASVDDELYLDFWVYPDCVKEAYRWSIADGNQYT